MHIYNLLSSVQRKEKMVMNLRKSKENTRRDKGGIARSENVANTVLLCESLENLKMKIKLNFKK